MSLRQRALGLLIVVGAILAWAAVVVEVAMDHVGEQRAYVTGTLQRGQDLSLDTLVEALNQETGARGFVLTGDPAFLDPYDAGREAVSEDLALLTELFAEDPETLALVGQVRDDFAAWGNRSQREVRAAAGGDLRLARRLIEEGEGKAAFDQLRTTFWTITAVLVGMLLASLLLLRRWVLVPVDRLRRSMRVVAAGS